MMKKIVMTILAILAAILLSGSAFAAEAPEVITETQISVISEKHSNEGTIINTVVEIEGKRFIKIHTIRYYDGGKLVEHFVRYVEPDTARIVKTYHWQEKNGKVVFQKGKKVVVIVTKK